MTYIKALLIITSLIILSFSAVGQVISKEKPVTSVLSLEKFDETVYHQLNNYLSGKNVIGLGEATHGTSEFFSLKAELIKYLIKERGFKTIVFEAYFTNCEPLNQYILSGEGNPYKVIWGMGYYIYYTQEFYDLIEWLKEYNVDKEVDDKVKVYGCDMTAPQVTLKKVMGVLLANDLLTNSLSESMDWMINQPVKRQYSKTETEIIKKLAVELNTVFRELDQHDALLQYYNRVLQQCFEYLLTKNGYLRSNKRDKFMAENTMFIYKIPGNNDKMIVWEHNVHIAKHSGQEKLVPMGKHMVDNFGDSYYAIGFGFNRGGFIALNSSTKKKEVIKVEDAEEDSSDLHFARNQYARFFMDFKSIDSDNQDYRWVNKKTISRNIGAVYSPVEFNRNYRKHILSKSFDALIFVRDTTPVKILDFNNLN